MTRSLDLSVDPGRFLASVTHLWNPAAGFGMVPDQAYGYLFPMGPYYWLGSAVGLSEWIVQRVWSALLLTTAFWGTIRLAESLGVGGRWSRLAGGVAYASSPLLLAQIHDTSYVMPAVLLPWVLVPLIRAYRGELTSGSAAARSPGWPSSSWAVSTRPPPSACCSSPSCGSSPAGHCETMSASSPCGPSAVAAATAWFVIPLLFQGRYGFSFLAYTETACDTTGSTNVPEVLRGAGIWTSFGVPVWTTAGNLIESAPAVIVASSIAAGAGLFGLARRDLPERRWLGVAVVATTVLVTAGYWGNLGGPFASEVHRLFDGPLSAFRNVYKFQPVITLPLVIGLVHVLSIGACAGRKLARNRRAFSTAVLVAGAVAVVGISAAPLPTGQVYPEGSFTALPAYWQHAVGWLNHAGGPPQRWSSLARISRTLHGATRWTSRYRPWPPFRGPIAASCPSALSAVRSISMPSTRCSKAANQSPGWPTTWRVPACATSWSRTTSRRSIRKAHRPSCSAR